MGCPISREGHQEVRISQSMLNIWSMFATTSNGQQLHADDSSHFCLFLKHLYHTKSCKKSGKYN